MKTFKWSEQQKKALRGSIRKWKNISDNKSDDKGWASCPCCVLWNGEHEHDLNCHGCPIAAFTGEIECNGSPYRAWTDGGYYIHTSPSDITEEGINIAKAEYNFLRAVYLAGGGK